MGCLTRTPHTKVRVWALRVSLTVPYLLFLPAVAVHTSCESVNTQLGLPTTAPTAAAVKACFERAVEAGGAGIAVQQDAFSRLAQFAVQLVRYSLSKACRDALGGMYSVVLRNGVPTFVFHVCKSLGYTAGGVTSVLRSVYKRVNELTAARVYLLGEALLLGDDRKGECHRRGC